MKFYTLLFSIVFSTISLAQANFVSTYAENPNYNAMQLHELPWDETRLYQFSLFNDLGTVAYTIEQVAFNTVTPVVPPLCSQILAYPTVLDDGLLIVGATSSGVELVYFDDVNSTVYDLNSGAGDSDPVVWIVNDRVFVIAYNGVERQLYEFDQTLHTLTEITSSLIPVEAVCAVQGDAIFYQTKLENTSMGEDIFTLMKASPSGGSFAHVLIQQIGLPSSLGYRIDWKSAQEFQGNQYFMVVRTSLNGVFPTGTNGLILVDQNDMVSTSSLVLPYDIGEFYLLQWDGQLGVYATQHDTIYTSSDGWNFTGQGVPANGQLMEHHVAENDELYFTCYFDDFDRDVYEFDGSFQQRFDGEHVHFLSEQEGVLYYVDYIQTDSSSIVMVYSDIDVEDEVKVHQTLHPPHIKSSVMFNGLFTFLFGAEGSFIDDNDIFQITGSPLASIDEMNYEFSIHPNPVYSGEDMLFTSEIEGKVNIITADGKHVKSCKVLRGENRLSTSDLSSGGYFITFGNHTQSFVVN